MKGISGAGRLTNYLWVATVISVIVILFGLYYYLETAKKERYFDQLYFRQLEEISRGFETNLVRLRSFTRETQNFISEAFDEELTKLDSNKKDAKKHADLSSDNSEKHKPETEIDKGSLASMLSYQELIEAQFDLNNYVTELTKADLVKRAKNDILDTYVDIKSDINNIFTPEFERSLNCGNDGLKPAFADEKLHQDYCYVLNNIIAVLSELPAYAVLAIEKVDNKSISDVKASINVLEKIQKLAKTVSTGALPEELKLKNDIIDFLDILAAYGLNDKEPKIPYSDLRSRFQKLKAYFSNNDLRDLLEQHYYNENCIKPCNNTPDENLSDLYTKEIRVHVEQKSRLLANFLLKQSIFLIAENIPSLVVDLEKFTDAAVKVQAAKKRQPKSKSAKINVGELLESAEKDKRKKVLLEEDKKRYLAESGPVEASVLRHGLGLQYKKALCNKKIEERMQKKNCEGALFISSLNKANPYPVSNLTVTSYLPDGYAFTAPMENLLPKEMGQFDAALITSEDGDVIIQSDSLQNLGNQHFLGIKGLMAKATKSAANRVSNDECNGGGENCKTQNNKQSLNHSAFVDETIGGITYRLYIRPHTVGQVSIYLKNKTEPQSTLYFVGIKPLAELRANKLKITPGASMALFSIVVAIMLVFVFLKVILAHVDASFTRAECLIAVFAIIVFISLSTIGIATLGLWEKLNREIESDANKSIDLIQARFNSEIQSYIKFVDYLMTNKEVIHTLVEKKDDTNHGEAENGSVSVPDSVMQEQADQVQMPDILVDILGMDVTRRLLSYEPITEIKDGFTNYKYGSVPYISKNSNRPPVTGMFDTNPVSPIENFFMLDYKGRLSGGLIRGTRNMVSFPPKDLSARKYFSRAHENNVWEMQTLEDWLINCPLPKKAEAILKACKTVFSL